MVRFNKRLRKKQISIHALREEGDIQIYRDEVARVISIHALREEGDIPSNALPSAANIFLSTPSARRATLLMRYTRQTLDTFLSTPSARRATAAMLLSCKSLLHFYPRPPRGGRQGNKPQE